MKPVAFSLALMLLTSCVHSVDGNVTVRQNKVAVDSLSAFQGLYQGRWGDLMHIFPVTGVNRQKSKGRVAVMVSVTNKLIRIEAIGISNPQLVREISVNEGWNQGSSEIIVSKHSQSGLIREDAPPGYGHSTRTVKLFLNPRGSLIVEEDFSWMDLVLFVFPIRVRSEQFYELSKV